MVWAHRKLMEGYELVAMVERMWQAEQMARAKW